MLAGSLGGFGFPASLFSCGVGIIRIYSRFWAFTGLFVGGFCWFLFGLGIVLVWVFGWVVAFLIVLGTLIWCLVVWGWCVGFAACDGLVVD